MVYRTRNTARRREIMRWLFLLIPLLCWRAMATGLIDPEDGMVDMSRYLQENPYGFLPIPLVITEPAVGYGGGLFGLFLHGKGRQVDGQFIPPAMSAFGGGGTQNGTWFVGGGHRHTWQDDHIRYLVAGGYADVNLDIYSGDVLGFGNNRAVETETRGYGGMQKLLFRAGDSPVFLGASQFWAKMDISARNNPLVNQVWRQLLGESSITSALGLVAEYDTTDNFFWPGRGLSLSGEYQFYGHYLGGDYRYDLLTLEGKFFLPLNADWTLSLAGDYQTLSQQDKHLPPMARPYIELRGISRYRYQGDDVSTVQTQLAWQMSSRWIVLGFVGAGSAADSTSELYRSAEVAWGSGIRYLIAREYGLRTGVDVAFSDNEQAVYFNVGSGL
ncbi:BamA/TamA family outer membrane protein [Citrobacter freundii]|nr:glyceraldehyde-3-phosphate dehydrogenase [Citrobacter freundii complex sp. CFNIH9]MBA7974847.1 BamA/TamA family outer membrane protein [Citrobacter freundii]MBM6610043.1 BamA/TamA family outer membrane protein [Citrobacter portucalensis]MBJ9321685.1 BamA/TamA family outer membrane protein [Citrobacter freundii]MBJ9340438.1 BamA/TamA family outer membrane protein [Citrobacter freundii]